MPSLQSVYILCLNFLPHRNERQRRYCGQTLKIYKRNYLNFRRNHPWWFYIKGIKCKKLISGQPHAGIGAFQRHCLQRIQSGLFFFHDGLQLSNPWCQGCGGDIPHETGSAFYRQLCDFKEAHNKVRMYKLRVCGTTVNFKFPYRDQQHHCVIKLTS